MNERIQQLMDQANAFARETVEYHQGDDFYEFTDKLYTVSREKFAELIIQKCISQIALIGVGNFENDVITWTVETAITSIEEHFGVKE